MVAVDAHDSGSDTSAVGHGLSLPRQVMPDEKPQRVNHLVDSPARGRWQDHQRRGNATSTPYQIEGAPSPSATPRRLPATTARGHFVRRAAHGHHLPRDQEQGGRATSTRLLSPGLFGNGIPQRSGLLESRKIVAFSML
jgi:hypothetical protein